MVLPRTQFNPSREVSEPQKLFGRAAHLESLRVSLCTGTHTEVVAERKFGKSSLLHCAEVYMRGNEKSLVVYIAVNYLDCRNWAEFYAWLVARVLARLDTISPDLFKCVAPRLSRQCQKIDGSGTSANEIFARLQELDARNVLPTFALLFEILADLEVSVILLLDEISTALKYFDGDPDRFQYLRELAMADGFAGCKPLTICTADRAEWQDIISRSEKSPGLNFISNHLRLSAISEEDAGLLLRAHFVGSEPPYEMPADTIEAVLALAKAYPYYLKVAGEKAYLHMVQAGRQDTAWMKEETYSAVRGHLSSYIRACDAQERKALFRVISSPVRAQDKDIALRRLFGRGLLRIDDGVFRPFNELFRWACEEFL